MGGERKKHIFAFVYPNECVCRLWSNPNARYLIASTILEKKQAAYSRSLGSIPPEVLTALRQGDHGAFREVYLHYATPVRDFLTLLTRSADQAEEITQEIFITLWEKRERIDPDKSIKGYLYTIARNSALKLFEQQKVRSRYAASPANRPDDESASDQILIAEETELLIEIAVSRMPDQRRRVFELSRKEGLKSTEIAERLGISRHTVDNHLATAKKELRQLISLFLLLFIAQ